MFRHEIRTFKNIHRRHYTTHLLTYETLCGSLLSGKAKESFLENYERQTSRLQVFTDIHNGASINCEAGIEAAIGAE